MTMFEFISVMVSIILGLSITQLLTGVSRLARNSGQVDAYLPHTLWLVNFALLHFLMWWSLWDFRDASWNYARFMVIVSEPLLMFLTTSFLIPGRFDNGKIHLREYFHGARKWFFLSFFLLQVCFILDGPVVFQSEPIWSTYRLSQLVVASVTVLGYFSRREWAQQLSAWTVFVLLIWSSGARFLPAAFE